MGDSIDPSSVGRPPAAHRGGNGTGLAEAVDPLGHPQLGAGLTAAEVLESLGQALIVTDADGRILLWNAGAEALYGWRTADVLGRDVTEVTVPHLSQGDAEEIMEALREGVPWQGGFAVQTRDGHMFPALVTDSGIYRDGALVGIVGESMSLGSAIRPLLEHSSDAAFMLTPDGTVSYASPAVSSLFGWQVDDLVGRTLADHVHPEDRTALDALLRPTADSLPESVVEIRVLARDEWVWVEAALSNLRADPGVRGLICNLRRSERLAHLEERERLVRAMHVGALQDLFAASLELDGLLLRSTPAQRPKLEAAVDSISHAIQVLREALNPRDV